MSSRLIFLLCLLTFTSGCVRYYYKPNAVNAAMLTAKHQLHVQGAGLRNSDGNGSGQVSIFDAQAAYSPIHHLGVLANYSAWNYKAFNPNPNLGHVDGHAWFAEAGIGAYHEIFKKKRISFLADLYAGGGFGRMKTDINMNATRLFLQPGIGLRSRFIDLGFNLRINWLRFSDFDSNGYNIYYQMQQHLYEAKEDKRIDEASYGFIEPAFTVRGGYKFLKLQFQVVYAKDLNGLRWEYNPIRFTAGLYFGLEDLLEVLEKR